MIRPARLTPKAFVRRLKGEPNELKRKMLLLGYLSNRLSEEGATMFLVGGQAVETYTGGVFATGDIDITTTDTKATEALLSKLGFLKEGMVWINAPLGEAVHLVASYPRRTLKVRTIAVEQFSVKVVGIEDLIVDRLAAAKFWKSERDGEQAAVLYKSFRQSIDLDYLESVAKEEKVDDFLERIRSTRPGRRRV